MALARVRLLATPEILSRMKAGDVDTATATLAPGRAATIVALGEARAVTPAEAGTRAPLGPVRVVEATVRVPVEASRGGWAYKGQPFKAGEPFNFETAHYLVRGEVSDVTASDRPALEPSRR
jgi:hypothetical protein